MIIVIIVVVVVVVVVIMIMIIVILMVMIMIIVIIRSCLCLFYHHCCYIHYINILNNIYRYKYLNIFRYLTYINNCILKGPSSCWRAPSSRRPSRLP